MKSLTLTLLLAPFFCTAQNWVELQKKLPGIWIEDELGDTPFGEYWQFDGITLSGYGFNIKDNDTLITEYFKIVALEQELAYLAHPVTQAPTAFWLIQPLEKILNELVYKFENLEHDYPKAISYRFVSDTLLHVCVYDSERPFCYHLRKSR